MRFIPFLGVAAAALLALSPAVAAVVGNGKIVEETRAVGELTEVHVAAGIRAVVSIGPAAPLKLRGEENVLPMVVTTVEKGRLSIGWRPHSGVRTHEAVEVTVRAPRIETLDASGGAELRAVMTATPSERVKIEATGGSHVRAASLAIKDVAASASGGSEIELVGVNGARLALAGSGGAVLTIEGKAGDVSLHSSGGTVLKGKALSTERLALQGSGGAEGVIHATGTVSGNLSGGSSIHVGKNAAVQVSTSGGSEVVRDQ